MSPTATSIAAPAVGEGSIIADKFRLERLIGEGGMGVVYAAVHLDLVKHVAIKIVREELSTRHDAVERMLHEARTAASLRSEHVARVLDMGRLESGVPYIVMEYLDGCDLAWHLLDRGTLEPEVAVSFILQACEAVAEAHVAGVVHRDIKPENLFLAAGADGEPMIKVLDFGISKNLARDRTTLTDPAAIVGSPAYMAPEAMQSKHLVGPAADMWSLGAVLHELCTGRRPFDADTIPEVCARVLGDEPPPLRALAPHAPEELEAIVARCLRKDPRERFESVSDLAAALAPFGSSGSIELAQRVARVASGIRLRPRAPGAGAAAGTAPGGTAPPMPPPVVAAPVPDTPRRKAAPRAPASSADRPDEGATPRAVGLVVGGVGLGTLAMASIFGIQAITTNDGSLARCRPEDPSLCSQSGVAMREEAAADADVATALFVVGGGLLAGGVVLVLTAPQADQAPRIGRLGPVVASDGGGMMVGGAF